MPETASTSSSNINTHSNATNNHHTLTAKTTSVDTAIASVETTSQPQPQPQPQSSLQRNGNHAGSPPALNDDTDDSNPQQGAPLLQPPPPPPQWQTTSSTAVPSPSRSTEAAAATAVTTKVPPTIKDDRKIFVGGLPSDVTPEEFLHCFEQFGTVIDSVIMYDRITTRSRGFGFITFESPQTCRLLIQMKRIPMRPEKFVEIKEAQPRETTMTTTTTYTPNQTYPLHSKYRRAGDGSMIIPNAPFVPRMNPVAIGEPSMMDPSYMGMAYGSVSSVPQSSPPVGTKIIDFSSYPTHGTLSGSPPYYSSNIHFSNNAIFVPDTTTTSEEGPTNNNMFVPSSVAPSNFHMPYGETYLSSYGIENTYQSSTMSNGTSDELSPPMYPISMPYYNNQYISVPPPSDMTNHYDSPHRTTGHSTMVYPYDPHTTMSPTRSFYMAAPSYLPMTELTPPFIGDTKLEHPSSPHDIVEGVSQLNLSAVEPTNHHDTNDREEKESMTKTLTTIEANGDQKINDNQAITE